MGKSEMELYLEDIAKDNNIALVKEHQFHPKRRWRFDFADLDNMVAIELEGGVWSYGRHNRASGFIKDLEKYNAATVLGWRVLRYHSVDDIHEHFIHDYTNLTTK